MQVEILPGKELINPPEVSFELLLVTAVAKRKQRDSRDSYWAPKYLYQKGDAVVWAEANTWHTVSGTRKWEEKQNESLLKVL